MDREVLARPLVPLPPQPEGVPWPTERWPEGQPPTAGVASRLDALLDEVFDPAGPLRETLAVVVVHRGRLVAERYAPAGETTSETTLISWSMAKSMIHAAVGILLRQGRLTTGDLDRPAPVDLWHRDAADRRATITLEHLLTMRDGLAFVEDYVDEEVSDVIEMLFASGQKDVARFAADRPLAHPPGEHFNYSSGTTNIVSRIVGDLVGGGPEGYEAFLRDELFAPIGMSTATPRFDDAGTFIASSFVYATARDFARFGYLYLRDGVWDGRRVLPEGWVDHARRIRSQDPDNGNYYGAQWWVVGDGAGGFWANGYEGQSILVVPGGDLVVVRLGKTPAERYPLLKRWRAQVTDAFAGA